MSETNTFGAMILKELEAEVSASRKCLERIPETLFEYKPHEKSMKLGYLALLVAEIPKWIVHIAETDEIDFATFEHFQPENTAALVKHFDENVESARKALQNLSDETLSKTFYLKNQGQVLFSASKKDNIEPALNHLVHHRGQLTIYMRLNDIPVPSIYGPSADEQGF